MLIRMARWLLVIVFLSTVPALSGGFLEQTSLFIQYHETEPDGHVSTGFANKYLEAGSSPKSMMEGSAVFREGRTDLETTLESQDAYFSSIAGKTLHELVKSGDEPTTQLLNIKMYLIMPGKFDSVQSIDIRFPKEDPSHAEITTTFTYNGVTYPFTKELDLKEGDNELEMFLQPYCDDFVGLDIASQKTFSDSISVDGGEFEGSMSMTAVKI